MKITSIEPQKKKGNRFSIFIDGNYMLSLEDIDLVKLGLKEGQEITNEDIEFYKQTYEFSKAVNSALSFISFKRRTQSQLEKKLFELGYDGDLIQKVILKMKEYRYLDDEQYAEDFIKESVNLRPSGKRMIAMQLKNKGVNEHIIREKIESSDIDEYNIARELAKKRILRIQNIDKKELQKVYAFLMRKGFSSGLVLQVLRDLQNTDFYFED